jgi:hypothetical protein
VTKVENISPAIELLREASGLMLSVKQVGRLRYAAKLFERGTDGQKKEAGKICDAVRTELKRGLSETIRMENLRAGPDEQADEPTHGPARLPSRDGFQALSDKGKLTNEQYNAGLAFRQGWELRGADVGSQMGAGEGRAGHDNDRFVFTRLQRAYKLSVTGRIEIEVGLQCRDNPACLAMLKAVAGDGKTLRSQGGGDRYAANMAALLRALDVAAEVMQ